MGKKKKTTERVVLYYRGPITKPHRMANDEEMKIIHQAIKKCFVKGAVYKTKWNGQLVVLKLVAGLSSTLRYLKQKRTKAVIYNDTAAHYLTKYLNDFANQINIPIVQASNLKHDLKLKSLMVISLIEENANSEDEVIEDECFDKLCRFLQDLNPSLDQIKIELRAPNLEKVPVVVGRSRELKLKRKQKEEHVV